MQKVKTGDEVQIIAGKSKGRTGKVLKVLRSTNKQSKSADKLIVEGANMVKKHVRGNPQQEKPGGIIEKEAPIDLSNVMLCDNQGKPSRVGIRTLDDGRKVRYYKTTNEVIDG